MALVPFFFILLDFFGGLSFKSNGKKRCFMQRLDPAHSQQSSLAAGSRLKRDRACLVRFKTTHAILCSTVESKQILFRLSHLQHVAFYSISCNRAQKMNSSSRTIRHVTKQLSFRAFHFSGLLFFVCKSSKTRFCSRVQP